MEGFRGVLFVPMFVCLLLFGAVDSEAQQYPLPRGDPDTWDIPGREQRLYPNGDWGSLPPTAGGPERYWEDRMVWDKYGKDRDKADSEADVQRRDESERVPVRPGTSGR